MKRKESEVAQLCPTLCDPMGCSLPCSSIHGIFQARVLEWAAFSFSRGSSWPRDRTWVSCIVGRCFTVWATREVSIGPCSPWNLWRRIHPCLFIASSDLPTIFASPWRVNALLQCPVFTWPSFSLFLHTIFPLCMSILVPKFPLLIESLSYCIRVHLNDFIFYLVTSVKILFTNKITF